jgi:hypothetical protein
VCWRVRGNDSCGRAENLIKLHIAQLASDRTRSPLANQMRLTHVPPNAPVAQFWSFTVYDNESRCFVDTGVQPDRSSRDNIVKNADGSVDLYFGPKAPAGKPEVNWIKTIPGKGWFTYFRLYGPTQPYFDRTWVLPDIEEMK